jgi:lysophospholipase L1-like esterase
MGMTFVGNRVVTAARSFNGKDGDFVSNFVVVVVLILGLLGFNLLPGLMGHSWNRVRVEHLLEEMHSGDLNRDDVDALTAGYYEDLRKDAGIWAPIERDDLRFTGDFRRYELKPNVKRRYLAGMRITNSLGMANPEYGYDKPAHTRRIAVIGDSISLGPYGHDYVALLENRLNQDDTTPEIRKYQILNFSVPGYTTLQMMDVVRDVAPKFHPDVYFIALTHLQASAIEASTGLHIARLEAEGGDLKYDYLRQIAALAEIKPNDPVRLDARKLAPYHMQMTRWALQQMKSSIAAQGAQMVIVLVPAPLPPAATAEAFDEIRPAVDSIGVPVIDLRDTFIKQDLEKLQVNYSIDVHPNALGHELIYENLYRKIQQDPKFAASLLGYASQRDDSAARSQ